MNSMNRRRYPKSLWSYNPLPSGCVFYYPAGRLVGPAFKSIDPFGHELTTTGTTLVAQGRNFQGAGNVDITALLTALAATTVGTLSMWVRMPDATPLADNIAMAFGDTDVNEGITAFRLKTNSLILCFLVKAAAVQWQFDTDAGVMVDNTWTLLSLTQDGTEPVLYAQGVKPAQAFVTTTDKTAWFADATNLDNGFLGKLSNNGSPNQLPFTGDIGEVWAHDYALSADEELFLYNRTVDRHS